MKTFKMLDVTYELLVSFFALLDVEEACDDRAGLASCDSGERNCSVTTRLHSRQDQGTIIATVGMGPNLIIDATRIAVVL